MELSLFFALKRVLSGITSIFLIAGIKKSKSAYGRFSIRNGIKTAFRNKPKQARQLYGNDIDLYMQQNHDDDESFRDLVVTNAFRPLIVMILISVFDFSNFYLILYEVILVILIVPIEVYFGDQWKNKKWYLLLIIAFWATAFFLLAYSNSYQEKLGNNGKKEVRQDSVSIKNL